MDLKHLTNQELHSMTQSLARKERLCTLDVLWHLREIERRLLYAEMGYRDLKEYCVRELHYSEGSAWRRISAMKVLKEVPEVEEKLESGSLNLTQLSLVRSHFREIKSTLEEKKGVLRSLENQDVHTTQRILAESRPEPLMAEPPVHEKPLKGKRLQVTLILDEDVQQELDELLILLGQKMTKLELFKLLVREKLESLRKKTSIKMDQQGSAAQSPRRSSAAGSRYISKAIQQQVRVRDQYRCQYRDPESRRQCSARFHLQVEHIRPFAKGGGNDVENLQLLCPTHNRLRAVQHFGEKKMRKYLPQLQP
ncbi:MAG: HNH endonuclease [Bdellovibrionales bacterium]